MTSGIVFQMEAGRVLQLLAREIYDSPMALLRENVQNAYDAVRMRFVSGGTLEANGRIDIRINDREVIISDNGIGMTEEVLRNNFWKAGSSGKHSEEARKAGVIGTFGIGAMANFGVATELIVETRGQGTEGTLRSVARRETLKLAEECISLERLEANRDVGTTVTAILDEANPISSAQAANYLEPYVSVLPVRVFLNGDLISRRPLESRLALQGRQFTDLATVVVRDDFVEGRFTVSVDPNGQVLARVDELALGGMSLDGEMVLLQAGGQLMGLRSYFGLAPVPAIGHYQFGGLANLSFLQPTAGREAITRESIDQVTRILTLTERASSEVLASTPWADKNNAFLNWVNAHARYDLVTNVSIRVYPDATEIKLGEIPELKGSRTTHYYTGTDPHIIATFANESSWLMQIAQHNPRRSVQLHYVSQILNIAAVPDTATVTRVFSPRELTIAEASILIRIASILRDDYLIADAEVNLAHISHGVTVLALRDGDVLQVYLARNSSLLPPLIEFYDKAYEIFTQFMKDFVRVHIYPRIQQFVPSSTKEGVDALRELLERNRELYRYDEAELGELEGVLGDLLTGEASFAETLRKSRARARVQTQRVSADQVGSIEAVVPDVVTSPVVPIESNESLELSPQPPILREDILSSMKVLSTSTRYPQLNNFTLLLGLSDRLMRAEAPFFHVPHTTRVLWGGHRIIYIFTDASERLSMYYDIELRNPIDQLSAGGGPIPTTTLITKTRIFVPVPDQLVGQFEVSRGAREFFVRFDVLSSDTH